MRPSSLRARVGGFGAPTFVVECKDGNMLVYTAGSAGEMYDFTPSAAAWETFKAKLDQIGVWEWQGDYHDRGILDGAQWEFEVKYPDRSIRCYGSNAYPPGFKRLLEAISALAGRRPFGCSERVLHALDIVRRATALGDYDSNVIGMAAEIIAQDEFGMEKAPRGSKQIDGYWNTPAGRRSVQVKAWSEARIRTYRNGTFFRIDEVGAPQDLLVLLVLGSGYEVLYNGPRDQAGKIEKGGAKRVVRFDHLKSRAYIDRLVAELGPSGSAASDSAPEPP